MLRSYLPKNNEVPKSKSDSQEISNNNPKEDINREEDHLETEVRKDIPSSIPQNNNTLSEEPVLSPGELFAIKPKEKKLPKAITHKVITPEIEATLLAEFDNVCSHLEYSRAELIESLMRDYITLVKQTNPEYAERPAARSGRRRRRT